MIKRYNARVDASYLCIFVGLNYSIQTLFSFLRLIDEHASEARESERGAWELRRVYARSTIPKEKIEGL